MADPYRLDAAAERLAPAAATVSRDVLAVHASDVDARARFPRESLDAVAAAGLLGVTLPASAGGAGLGKRAFAAISETLATGCGSTAMIAVMHVAAAQAIASSASLADRDARLRRLATGEELTTLAFSERRSRSQV